MATFPSVLTTEGAPRDAGSLTLMTESVVPVVLSGGSGTRLWPLSSTTMPKQLHRLVGDDTMLRSTLSRVVDTRGALPIVVCGLSQVGAVAGQLAEGEARIVVEPTARNTAPAVAAAALLVPPETVLAVFPADHVIADGNAFAGALARAVTAAKAGHVVTFGIVPSVPATGFGYIEFADGGGDWHSIVSFVEKPDQATAEQYVSGGVHLWNSGMFVFRADVMAAELETHAPAVWEAVRASVESRSEIDVSGRTVTRLGDAFSGAPSISIDYAVMERTERGVVVPLDAGWSDVGSWEALWEIVSTESETVTIGEVMVQDVARSYVRSETKPVAVIGVDDVVVIQTDDAVLVVDRRRAQEVRDAAAWFKELGLSD